MKSIKLKNTENKIVTINLDDVSYVEPRIYLKTKRIESLVLTYNNLKSDMFMQRMNDSWTEEKVLDEALKTIWNHQKPKPKRKKGI